jgi:hypothetical protein
MLCEIFLGYILAMFFRYGDTDMPTQYFDMAAA